MATTETVKSIKASLSKELQNESLSDESLERCKDMLARLSELPMTLGILSETLIGTVVSKLKTNEEIGPIAKSLVKKWKKLAKSSEKKAAPQPKETNNEQSLDEELEWAGLPPLRKNICKKLRSFLALSKQEMTKMHGFNPDALAQLFVSRAEEIEEATHHKLGKERQSYTEKGRTLCFNIKKNKELRSNILLGVVSAEELVAMTSEQLATSEKNAARKAEVNKLRDSRRLDWEQANEKKINEMCGIKGDLLSASLFTCSRCKSTKTTSTQKQTRSADEPMTVFVLCMNCGKRWKC